jgi:hypothetical protein
MFGACQRRRMLAKKSHSLPTLNTTIVISYHKDYFLPSFPTIYYMLSLTYLLYHVVKSFYWLSAMI